MSAVFSLRRCADEDGRTAGGKTVRSRRTRAADRTPYTRPQPPAEEPVPESSGNPNWLSGLIYPAIEIASGAGRILSAVFGPDSLSSSSSGGDCCSEDEDDESDAADVDLNQGLSSMNAKRENVRLIQQLVMQKTFSREECYELIKLIRSRSVKWDGNLSNAEIMSDARNSAVMEAREWLQEHKSRSDSKSKAEDRIYATNHGALSLVTHGEKGSPVDVAKSYMKARPTWSSPALKHVEFRTPSPVSTKTWNVLNEIQKAHSEATEELLAKTPSTKISLVSVSLEDISMQDTMTNNVNDEMMGDKLHGLTSLTFNSDPKPSLGLPATNSVRLPESAEMERERSQGGALQSDNASLVPKQCQDDGTIQAIGDSDSAKDTDPDVNSNQLHGCCLSHEMDGSRDSGTHDHALSVSVADQTLEPRHNETIDAVESSKEKVDVTVPDNLQLQNEHSNRVLSGSQDCSSMLFEDSLQDATQSDPNHERKDASPRRNLRARIK